MNKFGGQPLPPTSEADDGTRKREQASFQRLLDIDREMLALFNAGLLSHEFRLIMQAAMHEGLIVKDAAAASLLSSRAFHQLLKRLEAAGLIGFQPGTHDRRAKSIILNPRLLDLLSARFLVKPTPATVIAPALPGL